MPEFKPQDKVVAELAGVTKVLTIVSASDDEYYCYNEITKLHSTWSALSTDWSFRLLTPLEYLIYNEPEI